MFKRGVKPLDDILNKFLRDEGLETPLLQRRLVASWDEVVGSTIANYSGERFIRNQTLFVKISNPALRQDLSMMRSQLVRRLNDKVGSMVIAEIKLY